MSKKYIVETYGEYRDTMGNACYGGRSISSPPHPSSPTAHVWSPPARTEFGDDEWRSGFVLLFNDFNVDRFREPDRRAHARAD